MEKIIITYVSINVGVSSKMSFIICLAIHNTVNKLFNKFMKYSQKFGKGI